AVHVLVAGRRDDHFLRPGLQVSSRLGLAGEKPGALHDQVDAERLPGQLGGIALGDHLDRVAVHHDRLVLHFHGAGKSPVGRVVPQEMRVGLRIAQVVDGHELQAVLLAAFVVGAQDIPADAAETVDCYLDHRLDSPKVLRTAFAMFSAVKPKCLKRSPAGADSPKRSMPTTAPSSPTYLRQKSVTPASIATRGKPLGSTCAL